MSTANSQNKWGFIETLESVPSRIAEVLSTYSSIPEDDQAQHITNVRNTAWKTYQYPCLARFRFIDLDLSRHPLYQEHVLTPLRNSKGLFLDLGTCLGQDIRKLIHDGADPKCVYGSDVYSTFIDAGYDLFRDEHKLPRDHFLCPASLLESSDALSELDGKVTILQVGSVFHQFTHEQQEVAAERCLRLLKPSGKVLVLGNQIGTTNPARDPSMNDKGFVHSNETWKATWDGAVSKGPWKDTIKGVEVWSRVVPLGSEGSLEKVKGEQVDVAFGFMMWSVWVDFGQA